jgi:hypothetical protein
MHSEVQKLTQPQTLVTLVVGSVHLNMVTEYREGQEKTMALSGYCMAICCGIVRYDMISYDMIWCYLIYKGIKEWSHAGILHMVSLVLGQQIITNLWRPQIESSLWCTFHSWAPNPSSFPIPFAGETLRPWNSPVLLPIPSDISESKWSMFPNIPIFF